MTFTITNIETERSPDGNTTISYIPNDYCTWNSPLKVVIPNHCANDREWVRAYIQEDYSSFMKGFRKDIIQVGDVI